MEWINEKAKTLKQGAIRAMFDRYDLLVTAPAYKEKLFGKAGGK